MHAFSSTSTHPRHQITSPPTTTTCMHCINIRACRVPHLSATCVVHHSHVPHVLCRILCITPAEIFTQDPQQSLRITNSYSLEADADIDGLTIGPGGGGSAAISQHEHRHATQQTIAHARTLPKTPEQHMEAMLLTLQSFRIIDA